MNRINNTTQNAKYDTKSQIKKGAVIKITDSTSSLHNCEGELTRERTEDTECDAKMETKDNNDDKTAVKCPAVSNIKSFQNLIGTKENRNILDASHTRMRSKEKNESQSFYKHEDMVKFKSPQNARNGLNKRKDIVHDKLKNKTEKKDENVKAMGEYYRNCIYFQTVRYRFRDFVIWV